MKWKCLEIEIEKWNVNKILENSWETRLSQVTDGGIKALQVWDCALRLEKESDLLCISIFWNPISVISGFNMDCRQIWLKAFMDTFLWQANAKRISGEWNHSKIFYLFCCHRTLIHSKSDKVCGLCFSVSKNLRKKCVNCDKEFGVNGAFFLRIYCVLMFSLRS